MMLSMFLKACIKKILIKNKWTINNLYPGPLVYFVYFWLASNMNYVGDHLLNIPTKMVPISVVISEKKIKM